MSSPVTQSEAPLERLRIAPWRGPVHFLVLISSATLAVSLLLSYVLLVAMTFVWIGLELHAITKTMAINGLLHWNLIQDWMMFLALGVTWVFMLRPLRPRPSGTRVALQVTHGTQPQLFEIIHTLCWHLKMPPPSQVWLDTTISIRSTMKNGLNGILTGETVMHIGMPVISVVTARELGGLLARELGFGAGGLGTLFVHTVREMNLWFYRAAMERDPWEIDLREAPKREKGWHKGMRKLIRAWMWLAKVPFMGIALAAHGINLLAVWAMNRAADQVAANVIGEAEFSRMQRKLSHLGKAWEAASQEIRRGVIQHRLPENLSLLMSRHVAKTVGEKSAQKANSQLQPTVQAFPPTGERPPGEAIVAHLPGSQPAAVVLRQFVDLSRQVTFFYYQHELELNLVEHRLVADEEVIHQNRREDTSLVAIRRYFSGLAHPERCLCGLGSTPHVSPGRLELQRAILEIRDEVTAWGPQLKAALQEWNIAWQRRRDLEAAAVLSLAGFTVSRIQFGTEDVSPGALRAEAARQRMVMEHMEGPLVEKEMKLESRFAAALGLLWWTEPAQLDDWLQNRRRDLPGWVGVYEAMAGALPSFRELLTTFFAFQTLGAKFANVDDPSALLAALQTVVPKMLNLVRQIIATMDGAVFPFTKDGYPVPLNQHLLPKPLPQMPGVSVESVDATCLKATALTMASDASDCIAPYVDAFLELYHTAFAWLCESAERVEIHFLGQLTFGSNTEVLLPEEFTTQKLGIKPGQPEDIAAWRHSQAATA